MERRILAIVGSAVLLAACQQDAVNTRPTTTAPAAPSGGAGMPAVEFRCPAAGTRVVYANGFTITHQGADPADSSVCRWVNSNGRAFRSLYGFYDLPSAGESQLRSGFASLWPLTPGRTASFTFIGTSASAQTFQYRDTWRVERSERLNVAGSMRDTLVLTRTQEGMLGNTHRSRQTHWLDVATRTWVKRQVELFTGTTGAQPYEATGIVSP